MLNFEIQNTLLLLLLSVGAPLGAFDVIYYHIYKFKLYSQPTARAEMVTHLARSILFGLCAYVLLYYQPNGTWFFVVAGILLADFFNSILDAYLEPESRAPLGGLPRNEYIIHIIGMAFTGAFTMAYFLLFWQMKDLPTGLEPLSTGDLPWWLVVQTQFTIVGSVLIPLTEGSLFIRSLLTSKSAQSVMN